MQHDYNLRINQGDQKKGIQFINIYTEHHTKEQAETLFKIGNSGQNATTLVFSNSLFLSFLLSFAANFNTRIHHYIDCEPSEFVDVHKQLRYDPSIEDNISIYNYDERVINNLVTTHYHTSEIDTVFVERKVDNFKVFIQNIWPKIKPHGILMIKNATTTMIDEINEYIASLEYRVPIQETMLCGYLYIKKPVAVERHG